MDQPDGQGPDGADQDSAAGRDDDLAENSGELDGGAERRGGGDPEQDERCRVVDQALPLQDRDHLPRQADPSGHRRRGDRVRRGHHRPEGQADGEGQLRQEQAYDQRDRERREDHESDRQQQDRPEVVAERRHRGLHRGHVEQRRQDPDQNRVGVEPDVRKTRHEGEPEPGDHEQHRGEESEASGQPGSDDRDRQEEDDLDKLLHGESLAPGGPGGGQSAPAGVRRYRVSSTPPPNGRVSTNSNRRGSKSRFTIGPARAPGRQ